ncbi:sn-glycerol-1-phosphate dehydrogenase [Radiobacillus deserti]|uniref:sn-glycerol-1-phosphate dehydrogenase n=1 Tax=Radiobacillus deserti TaxID=2594883 RepID=A0A516KCI0_9BACI|nr:sn-glycerol-1-phosphate dehydrogenase [Radiobacillus deserti]QDP39108.1 sn-glycerol-1-phosphate dehydrogenase [Radiobacillus deserti]
MEISQDIYELAKQLGQEEPRFPELLVERGALSKVTPYLENRKYSHATLVVDENTYNAAGKHLNNLLEDGGMETIVVSLKASLHNQVVADEATLVQLMVETSKHTDVLIAVGSGTIHDITRFCGYKMNIPFISVPTAASVDGFTSKGSPLILRGVKQTIQTAAPVALFADIDIIRKAPQEMTAAGFGDILGKYTSLFDWEISRLIGGEPYNKLAAERTRQSLRQCVDHVSEIAACSDEGMLILMKSLIESGLVMLLLDYSRPASGGEHHLSHYWEMDFLKKGKKQILHGAKVGVATAIIADLYKQRLGKIDYEKDDKYGGIIREHGGEILTLLQELPEPDEIKLLLQQVGGATTTSDLHIANTLVAKSLNEAFHLRDRCTGLMLINRFKHNDLEYPL